MKDSPLVLLPTRLLNFLKYKLLMPLFKVEISQSGLFQLCYRNYITKISVFDKEVARFIGDTTFAFEAFS